MRAVKKELQHHARADAATRSLVGRRAVGNDPPRGNPGNHGYLMGVVFSAVSAETIRFNLCPRFETQQVRVQPGSADTLVADLTQGLQEKF